jgi:hypothetical protein
MANILNVQIDFKKISQPTHQKMFAEIKLKLTSKNMLIKDLHGQKYKILARWLHMAVPRGKHTAKVRDELIDKGRTKLGKIVDESFTDSKILQDNPKVSGVFIPKDNIYTQDKTVYIQQVVSELNKTHIDNIYIDHYSMIKI